MKVSGNDPLFLKTAKSCCPICLSPLEGEYKRLGEDIYLERVCPEHGFFSVPVWKGPPSWDDWQNRAWIKNTDLCQSDCSLLCGSCTEHLSEICCVLLEVTARCNQACPYCFASSAGNTPPQDYAEPGIENISEWYTLLRGKGGDRPYNIHISGGEPTVREDLPEIISLGKAKGFPYIQLNTNGKRLSEEPRYAEILKESGLSAVFLQFDGIDNAVYRKTRGADLFEVKDRAVIACKEAGLSAVLAVTLVPGINDGSVGGILSYAIDRVPYIKGVHFQPVSYFGRYPGPSSEKDRTTIPELLRAIEIQTGGKIKTEDFYPSSSGHPACAFHGTFSKSPNGVIRPKKQPREKVSKERHVLSRDYVEAKWKLPASCCCGIKEGSEAELGGWDDFLNGLRRETFSITGMAFQDAWTMDLNRLSRCYVSVLSGSKDLIPFCAYNLTSSCGTGLFRKNEPALNLQDGRDL